jgi:hypothetical protein
VPYAPFLLAYGEPKLSTVRYPEIVALAEKQELYWRGTRLELPQIEAAISKMAAGLPWHLNIGKLLAAGYRFGIKVQRSMFRV